jgi:hypothetical protein
LIYLYEQSTERSLLKIRAAKSLVSKLLGARVAGSTPQSQIEAVFLGVMGRKPSEKELFELTSQLIAHGNLEAIVRDLVKSEEFSIQVMPQLVAKWTSSHVGKNIFFLHVPKTAGTSLRLALSSALGVPGLMRYRDFVKPTSNSSFWPFWVGHAGIAVFPETHTGFTVFRESKSRLLSTYRQVENDRRLIPRIPLDGAPRELKPFTPPPSVVWNHRYWWLESWYFLDEKRRNNQNGQPKPEVMAHQTAKEKIQGFERGLNRISESAWSHDRPAMLEAVNKLCGSAIAELPSENVFGDRADRSEAIRLTREDMKLLDERSALERPVLDVAISKGLIPKLDKQTEDDLFRATADRLGFILP